MSNPYRQSVNPPQQPNPYRRSTSVAIPVSDERIDAVRQLHPKVTDRQAELVETLLQQGCTITAAAYTIGAARTWAVTSLKKQHVQAYAMDLAQATMVGYALRAVKTAGALLESKDDRVRATMARDIMDRAGMRAQTTRMTTLPSGVPKWDVQF